MMIRCYKKFTSSPIILQGMTVIKFNVIRIKTKTRKHYRKKNFEIEIDPLLHESFHNGETFSDANDFN